MGTFKNILHAKTCVPSLSEGVAHSPRSLRSKELKAGLVRQFEKHFWGVARKLSQRTAGFLTVKKQMKTAKLGRSMKRGENLH